MISLASVTAGIDPATIHLLQRVGLSVQNLATLHDMDPGEVRALPQEHLRRVGAGHGHLPHHHPPMGRGAGNAATYGDACVACVIRIIFEGVVIFIIDPQDPPRYQPP